MSFGDNIKTLRKKYNLTQQELGKIAGVGISTVSSWEKGVNMPLMGAVEKISKHFNILKSELLDDVPPTVVSSYNGKTAFSTPLHPISVPILGGIACGEPIYAPAEANMYATLNSDVKVDFALTATGDSMIDAHIFDGDIVFIREQPQVELGEIAAVSIDNEVTLKRVYYYPDENKVILTPANPQYAPMVYTDEQLSNIRIMGKAIAVQHML